MKQIWAVNCNFFLRKKLKNKCNTNEKKAIEVFFRNISEIERFSQLSDLAEIVITDKLKAKSGVCI